MLGRFSIGSSGKAMTPAIRIKMLQTVLSTGRLMNVSDRLMAWPCCRC